MADRTSTELENTLQTAIIKNDMNGIATLINSLTATEITAIRGVIYSNALTCIANFSVTTSGDTSTDSLATSTARTLMAKVGAYVSGDAISNAMVTLSKDYNFKALDAVTDYLTAAQKLSIPSNRVDDTILNIASYSYKGGAADISKNQEAADIARDLMVKLGSLASGAAIDSAMVTFTLDRNFAAVDSVTDYLTATQKKAITVTTLDFVLTNMASYSNTGGVASDISTNAKATAAIRDFMGKFGASVNGYTIANAITILSNDHNFKALDAVTDYLTVTQKVTMPVSAIDQTLLNIAKYGVIGTAADTSTNGEAAGVLRDFMSKLGAYASDAGVSKVAALLVNDHNFMALGALLDYVDADTLSYISTNNASLFAANGIKTIADAVTSFSGTEAGDVLYALGGNDVVHGQSGNDFVFGGMGNDTLYGDSGNDFLCGGLGTDVLVGGSGADTFAFETGAGVDIVQDFRAAEGDKLDISSLLTDVDPLTQAITNFIKQTTSGTDVVLSVDADGASAGGAVVVAVLKNVTPIDIQALFDNGQIIV